MLAEGPGMSAGVDGGHAYFPFHETHAHVVVGGGTRDYVGGDAILTLQVTHTPRHAHGVVGAEHETGGESLEFGVGQDGLYAVVTHDAVAGLGHDHIESATRELCEQGPRHLVGAVLSRADDAGVGEVIGHLGAVVAHAQGIAHQGYAGELGAAHP